VKLFDTKGTKVTKEEIQLLATEWSGVGDFPNWVAEDSMWTMLADAETILAIAQVSVPTFDT
jgi:hypothetical protein